MITSTVATILTTLVFAAGFFPFAAVGYLALTRNGRARHHWAAFVATRTTVHPPAATPPTPKEFPMRKIFLFCLAAAALIGVMALTGCGASSAPAASPAADSDRASDHLPKCENADGTVAAGMVQAFPCVWENGTTTESDDTVLLAANPVSASASDVATVCADVITTGEAYRAAQIAVNQAAAASKAAVDALMNSDFRTPQPELATASDEANAAHALANADLGTADRDYTAAQNALDLDGRNTCRPLTKLDMEFSSANMALLVATDTTRPAAQAKWDAAQAKWDAAKTS